MPEVSNTNFDAKGSSMQKLTAIQNRFMVYKWTMAMQFSFEYYLVPKDHQSEEEIKAIALKGAMRPKL